MSEWIEESLGHLAEIEIGGTPSRDVPAFWASENTSGHPWVSISDLGAREIYSTKERITDLGVISSNVKPVARGTLMMSFKLTIGRAGIAGCDLFTNEAIAAVVPESERLDSGFLYYLLPPIARRAVTDTAIKGRTLNKKTLSKLKLSFPKDIRQQRQIAEILSTLDETIERTEALIAKYQQIKAGLMHDLFTRGVTPDGRLRPTRAHAPHLYKESRLGWIPKEWDCLTIGDLLAKTFSPMRSGPFGSSLLKDKLVEEGVPFLGIDNVFAERFVPVFRRFVSRQKFVELLRYSVFPRDVIITIMGTVGRCCVVPDFVTEALSSKHLWTMTFDANRVFPELVCWQLNHARWVKDWFTRYSQGAVMEAIQSSTLRSLRLPVPQIEEQRVILGCYQSCSRRIEMEQEYLEKLRKQKQGLMHDLLTGRVRVKVDAAGGSDGAV